MRIVLIALAILAIYKVVQHISVRRRSSIVRIEDDHRPTGRFAVNDRVEVRIGTTWRLGTVIDVNPATCALGFDRSTYIVRLDAGKRATIQFDQIRRAAA
ncbi:MAG: hypothetical protein ACM3NH_01790 [Candidatus Saccharibacteria bacterium]